MSDTPQVTRTYLNHHLDSSRWENYTPRDDDIIVTTSYKSGTTFTQQILYHLLVGGATDDAALPPVDAASPWVDARFHGESSEELKALLEALPGRRFLKSHLPLDGLPYYKNVKYLIIGRDPRDVFMSLANHYGNYTDLAYAAMAHNNPGLPFPRFEEDIKVLWKNWISRGWFEWESEGYPFWSNLHHTQSYWDFKHLPNFMFLHYNDMRADLPGTIQRIASFIEHPLSSEKLKEVVAATEFESVRQKAIQMTANEKPEERIFAGGSAAFFYKGSNNRWKDVLDEEDMALYEATKNKVLSKDCALWLEGGAETLDRR